MQKGSQFSWDPFCLCRFGRSWRARVWPVPRVRQL